MTTIAFFNNKGGVGKTTLVYHLAWMYAEIGVPVVAVDLDPQANLSAVFLEPDRLEEMWPEGGHARSILGSVSPILKGLGDIADAPHVETVDDNLGLVVGDLGLSRFEARLSTAWPECLAGDEAAFRIESAFHRTILAAAAQQEAELALVDVGPNLGAINRAALIAVDFVVFPLAPDLFSLQALRNIGPTLRDWRNAWKDRLDRRPPEAQDLELPSGAITPAGYIVMQHAVRAGRPVQAYQRWIDRMPAIYRKEALGQADGGASSDDDAECLATLKHYRSLMAMAHEARKPMFHLRASDGALGGHAHAVQHCRADFERLARTIAARCGVPVE